MKFWWKNNPNCWSDLSEKKNNLFYIELKSYNFDIKSVTKIWPLFMHEWQFIYCIYHSWKDQLYFLNCIISDIVCIFKTIPTLEVIGIVIYSSKHYLINILNHSLKLTGIRLFIPDNTKNSRLCKTNILQYTKMKCSSTL